jgi:integrase
MKREWKPDTKVAGLGLLVLPTGVETWYLRLREPSGKQKHHRIGRAGVINRTLAREEAHKLLAAVAKGDAPTSARQELRHGPSMADLYERIKLKHHPKLRPNTVKGYECTWDLHIIPALGTTKVKLVTTTQVVNLIDKIGGTQANRTLAIIRKAFNLAILWGMRTENPCAKVPGNPENKRERYLSGEEHQRLMAALEAFPVTQLQWRFTQLIKLLMLTGCRAGEVCRGRWEWVDEKAGVMRLPAEHHKTGQQTGKKRVVHLPPSAILILRELRRSTNSPWIIAGQGDGPLIGYQKLWSELMTAAKIEDFRVHDLRHNYASVALTRVGLTLPQVGGLLGHTSPQTTQRYAHLIEDGAKAMAAAVADQLSSHHGETL